jgi:hypothetical protein
MQVCGVLFIFPWHVLKYKFRWYRGVYCVVHLNSLGVFKCFSTLYVECWCLYEGLCGTDAVCVGLNVFCMVTCKVPLLSAGMVWILCSDYK